MTSSINRERPKFSNLNCGEMVCNDVKYCPEKDADSYYGRTGSEPFNLKPPGSAPARENADPSVPLPIYYNRERVFSCALFSSLLSRFPLSNVIALRHSNFSFRTRFFSIALFHKNQRTKHQSNFGRFFFFSYRCFIFF